MCVHSLVDVRANLLELELGILAVHVSLVIGDVEEEDLEVKIDGWSSPDLVDLTAFAKGHFPLENELVGLHYQNGTTRHQTQ